MDKVVFNKTGDVLGFVCDFYGICLSFLCKSKIILKSDINVVCELHSGGALWKNTHNH